jgi:hypothetical protein
MKKVVWGIVILSLVLISMLGIVRGETLTSPANVSYDSELIGQFFLSDWVHVTIKINDNTNISIQDTDSVAVQKQKDDMHFALLNNTSNLILLSLSKNEFQLEGIFPWGNGFYGNITKKGFDKLLNDTRVKKIYADKEITNASAGTIVKNLAPYLIILILLIVLIIVLIKLKKRK